MTREEEMWRWWRERMAMEAMMWLRKCHREKEEDGVATNMWDPYCHVVKSTPNSLKN
jgi:hypothetical protein